MYTTSKRAAEWVASGMVAISDMLISAGRFTHVLDNSIIYKRLLSWADEAEGGVIRLHSPDIAFYLQSASSRRKCSCWPSSAPRNGSSASSPSAISAGRSA